MAEFPNFCGPSYQAQSPNWANEEAINLICEKIETQDKTRFAMFRGPGKKLFCNLPLEVSVPAQFELNGRAFAASAGFYEITSSAVVTQRGTLNGQPLSPTQICANQNQLLILSNGDLFVFTLATNVFVDVDMSQFNGPVQQIDFADGYFIATIQNTNTFQQSNLEDGTTWDGLNISTISLFPDNITSLKVNQRQPIFYSGKKIVIYYNAGAGFPVFIPIPNAFIENGAGATFATVTLDNSVFWLDLDERGGMIARRLNGTVGQRISTHAEELAWQSYSVNSDAVGWTYQEDGHLYWVIYFPTANVSWGYDVSTQLWHKRLGWKPTSGTYEADHAMSHMFVFGMHLVGDWASGNIYQQSMAFNDDNGKPIRWQRDTPTLSNENEWQYYSEFRLDVETGLGPMPPLTNPDGSPRDPQVVLQWSDDSGKTFSNEHVLNCGQAGRYGKLVRKRMLGRGRNRLFRLWGTDPVPWRFAGAYLDVS